MTSARTRLAVLIVAIVVTLSGQVTLGSAPTQAAETCTTTTVGTAYTATVCLEVPDGPLTGQVALSATVTVASGPGGVPPSVSRVVFLYRGGHLLSDYDAAPDTTYGMSWRTTRLGDGPGQLMARARLSDGEVAEVQVPVTLANGPQPPPPDTEAFTPRLGTPPGAGERFRIAAVGDGADGSPAGASVVDLIESMQPDVFAYLGDVYDEGSPYEFDNWYGDLTGYGRFRAITNPTVGNHEYRTNSAVPYFDFWGDVPHYYSYDVAGWHVVVLDSTVEFAEVAPGTPQYEWLAADLAANQGRCTLTYLHHPRYSAVSGVGREGLAQVWSLLVERGVTLMLTGHAHTYERWTPMNASGIADPGGLTQIIAGTGGREIMNPKTPDPRVLGDFTLPGALQLDLGTDDARFAFMDTDRNVLDSGAVPCRKPVEPVVPSTPAATLVPSAPAAPVASAPAADTRAPTTPGAVRASTSSPRSAVVSWATSTDEVGVAGYTVRRDGTAVATVDGAATSYADGSLAAGRTYSWSVDAFDAAGNRSAASAPVSATTPYPMLRTRSLLRELRRAPEHRRGWEPSRFPTWTDADGDGCTTRDEVLVAEAVRPPVVLARCAISGGRWFSPYDGVSTSARSRLTVDHLVPPREVWESGAHRWTPRSRRMLANDLGYDSTLAAVTRTVARTKGDQEPQTWLPPRPPARCTYVAEWVAVKWRWHLTVDRAERRFLVKRLTSCGWPTVVAPTRPRIGRR